MFTNDRRRVFHVVPRLVLVRTLASLVTKLFAQLVSADNCNHCLRLGI